MIIGGYTLHLYCDNEPGAGGNPIIPDGIHRYDEFPHMYAGHDLADCMRQARRAGWNVRRKNGLAYCPQCSKKKPAVLAASSEVKTYDS